MRVLFPTPNGNSTTFTCDTIPVDIPLLLALDLMRRELLIINARDWKLGHTDWSLRIRIWKNNLIIFSLSKV